MSVFHGYTYHLWCFQFAELHLVLLYLHELKKVKEISYARLETIFSNKAVTFFSWPAFDLLTSK